MIFVRAGLLALVAGLVVLALTQTAAAPPSQVVAIEASPTVEPTLAPSAPPTRVPLPTVAQMIISRVARETPTPAPKAAPSGEPNVAIVDYGYVPGLLSLRPGVVVVWTNTGSEGHDVNGNGPGGAWRSGPLAPEERFQRTFALAGTYDYACSFHPEMRGRIVVQP